MKPHVVVYCCANSAVVPEQHVEETLSEGDAGIKMVRLPCSGRTDVLYIVKAFEDGADMVMIVGCAAGKCQFIEGNLRAGMRVRYANKLLAEAGLGQSRVKMFNLEPANNKGFADALRETVAEARKIGPWL